MPLRFLTAGESHGPALTAILEGLPAGLPLSQEVIDRDLARRQQGYGAGPRMKLESDSARILGGVMEGLTTGAPLALQIENLDHAHWRGRSVPGFTAPRPGHADLSGAIKYGYNDLRPALERASARETAARVAVGAVCRHLLAQFGIRVGGYVSAIGTATADLDGIPLEERPARAQENDVHCPDPAAAAAMQAAIRQAMQDRDTLGGVIEVVALGVPPGLGSSVHWDRRLEARLGAAVLSVPAIKGVEIGPAFENARLPGTRAHDPILLEDGEIRPPDGAQRRPGRRHHHRAAAADPGGDEAHRHHPDPPADGRPGKRRAGGYPLRALGFLPGAAGGCHPGSHGGFCPGRRPAGEAGRRLAR